MAGLLDYVSGIVDQAGSNVKGLLSDPMQTASNIIDQLAQRAAAQQAATKAAWATRDPKVMAQNALDSSQTALGFAPLGITAWHGSPHKFDKFSTGKIGTGEGAQAYGHGLYLAESPDVARSYLKSNGTGEDLTVSLGGKDVVWGSELTQQQLDALKFLEGGKRQAGQFPHNTAYYAKKMTDDPALHKIIDEWKDAKIGYKSHSTMYKTDIPDEAVARFLDWDKPLSQQADILKAVFDNGLQHGMYRINGSKNVGDFTGGDLIQSLDKNRIGSARLQKLGIPGIRYLDGGSRGAGQGSSNFVAFDPEMIRILERNGQATGAVPWQPGEWRGLLGNN